MSADMSVGKGKEFEVITAIILGGVSLTGGKGTMLGALFRRALHGGPANVLRAVLHQSHLPVRAQGVILIGWCS